MLDRLGALLDDRPSKLCIRQESGDGIGKRVGISRSESSTPAPSCNISRDPPVLVDATGVPRARASSTEVPSPSWSELET